MMGGTRKGGTTPQGPNAAGPHDEHGLAPDDAPQPWGTGEKPFDARGGQPAADPEAKAKELLSQHHSGRPAEDNAGPDAAGEAPESNPG